MAQERLFERPVEAASPDEAPPSHSDAVLRLIQEYPGLTSKMLAATPVTDATRVLGSGFSERRLNVARALSRLHKRGLVVNNRHAQTSQRDELRWFPAAKR